MSKHRDAATSYLRVFYLYKEHDPLSALTAAVRAGDAFADATQLRNARDEYQRAVKFMIAEFSNPRFPEQKIMGQVVQLR